jgi:hypothetical protein
MGHKNPIVSSGQFENLLITKSAQARLVSVAKVYRGFPPPNAKYNRSAKIGVGAWNRIVMI